LHTALLNVGEIEVRHINWQKPSMCVIKQGQEDIARCQSEGRSAIQVVIQLNARITALDFTQPPDAYVGVGCELSLCKKPPPPLSFDPSA
jgi:hypothetical protein